MNPTPESLADWMYDQLVRIKLSLDTAHDVDKTFSAPTKTGADTVPVRYADGTGWDPGSGAGLYYWNGSAWTFIA